MPTGIKFQLCFILVQDNFMLDMHLSPHVHILYSQIRNRALVQVRFIETSVKLFSSHCCFRFPDYLGAWNRLLSLSSSHPRRPKGSHSGRDEASPDFARDCPVPTRSDPTAPWFPRMAFFCGVNPCTSPQIERGGRTLRSLPIYITFST